jgi:cyclophilin family peptidyl-prolyl cis-trans isomerase
MLLASAGAWAQQPLPNPKKFDYVVVISTEYGDIELLLFDQTPLHKANFAKLAHEGFYDSCTFHRVLDNFMVQGGDPNTKPGGEGPPGTGGPGYNLPAEIVEGMVHDQGMLAAARRGDAVNPAKESSGSQFYIVENRDGAHHLDGQYTVFGKVLKGMEVVEAIAAQPVSRQGLPIKPIYMKAKCLVMKRKEIEKVYGYSYPETLAKKARKKR